MEIIGGLALVRSRSFCRNYQLVFCGLGLPLPVEMNAARENCGWLDLGFIYVPSCVQRKLVDSLDNTAKKKDAVKNKFQQLL